MKLIEFSDRYPDEASCERELRSIREKNGIVCFKCGNKHHLWVKEKAWQGQPKQNSGIGYCRKPNNR